MHWWFLRIVIVLWATSALAGPTASFTASRGDDPNDDDVAPLAVFFDATATTHTDPNINTFHDLLYGWHFGDPNQGTWTNGSLQEDKNYAWGPVSAHVFPDPGDYTVTLTVTDPNGITSQATRDIEVDDPNTYFSGTNTICYRSTATGNFDGCPSGATQTTQSSYTTILAAHYDQQKRALLRRGDTFTGGSTNTLKSGPATLAAFGSGDKPKVTADRAFYVAETRDWRVIDIVYDASGGSAWELIGDHPSIQSPSFAVEHLLLYRMEVTNTPHNGIIVGNYSTLNGNNWPDLPIYVFFVESKFTNINGNIFYGALRRIGWLGNEFGSVPTHLTRLQHLEKGVVSYNLYGASATDKHPLPLRANSWECGPLYCFDAKWHGRYTEQVVVSHNRFPESPSGSCIDNTCGDYGAEDCRKRDIIFEGNFMVVQAGGGIVTTSQRITARNNVFIMPQHQNIPSIRIGTTAEDIQAYNNSGFDTKSYASPVVSSDAGGNSGHIATNNILWCPNHSGCSAVLGGGITGQTNLDNGDFSVSPYTVASPTTYDGFKLNDTEGGGQVARDAGTCVKRVHLDAWWGERPDSNCDAGAHEYGTSPVYPSGGATPTPCCPNFGVNYSSTDPSCIECDCMVCNDPNTKEVGDADPNTDPNSPGGFPGQCCPDHDRHTRHRDLGGVGGMCGGR
jgi:hypothetical protein